MKKELFLIIIILLIIFILISVFSNDTNHISSNYSQIEIQMRKLWY